MTRITLFSLLTVIMMLITVDANSTHDSKTIVSAAHISEVTVEKQLPEAVKHPASQPALPATKPAEHPKKVNESKLEELAHIHRFHKERVKKLKRHHQKLWLMSKVLIILCHLVLLIVAYMHVTH